MVMNEKDIWALLETVPDPEVPVLSVVDLGVVRAVSIETSSSLEPIRVETDSDALGLTNDETNLTITITPTYSGCPAMDMISMGIRMALLEAGYIILKYEPGMALN